MLRRLKDSNLWYVAVCQFSGLVQSTYSAKSPVGDSWEIRTPDPDVRSVVLWSNWANEPNQRKQEDSNLWNLSVQHVSSVPLSTTQPYFLNDFGCKVIRVGWSLFSFLEKSSGKEANNLFAVQKIKSPDAKCSKWTPYLGYVCPLIMTDNHRWLVIQK